MKKMKARWNQLSRPIKILLLLFVLLLTAAVSYIALDCPALTPMMGFRRSEKANMVGPSEILAEIDTYPEAVFSLRKMKRYEEKLIIAQSNDFDVLYNHNHHTFYAYPKSEQPALYCASSTTPQLSRYRHEVTQPLHLILFDRNEQAFLAIIKIKVNIAEDGAKPYYVTFRENVRREYNGFFYVPIVPEDISDVSALKVLQNSCVSNRSDGKTTIIVELYGANGLISTETILPGPSLLNEIPSK